MKVKEGLGSILILVAFGMLVGVASSFSVYVITAPPEEQVSIQEEEEMEVIGHYNTVGFSAYIRYMTTKIT